MNLNLPARVQDLRRSVSWHDIAIAAILAIAAFLRLYDLGQNGLGNTYYAAGVKSMLTSWRNFFYVSLDPGGFVSIDKPPLALWVQALSAKALGFRGATIILPQVLAGIASIGLLYYVVQRHFSQAAALLGAFALAVTPISVAVDRGNNLEPVLTFALLGAAAACLRATQSGDRRWAIATGALAGLAFETKMLQALIIVPALALVFLWGSELAWPKRMQHLALAAVALAVVGLAWPVAVDLTPKDSRPYVASSTNNSELDLIFGYNGIGRLSGGEGNVIKQPGSGVSFNPSVFDGGKPGPFRLLHGRVASQVMWLLPLGLFGIVAAWRGPLRARPDAQQQVLVLFAAWLLLHIAVFSFAKGIFHSYYLEVVSPPVAGLAGIGLVALWQRYRERPVPLPPGEGQSKTGVRASNVELRASSFLPDLLPIAILATGAFECYLLSDVRDWNGWLLPFCAAGSVAAAAALVLAKAIDRWPALPIVAVAAGSIVLAAAPIAWAITPLLQYTNGILPFAGPHQVGLNGRPLPASIRVVSPELEVYLAKNRGGAKYLVAVRDAVDAAATIIETGQPVMAMGGYVGTDPILTPDKLAELTFKNEVRFFLVPPTIMQPALQSWLDTNCLALAPGYPGPNGDITPDIPDLYSLYECTGTPQPPPS